MSVLNTLPAPVIQMGLVEKIVDAQQNQPSVQQVVAQATTRQELKEANSKVSGLETADQGKKVQERDAGQRNSGGSGKRPGRESGAQGEEPAPEGENAKTKPWSGHLVNLKV